MANRYDVSEKLLKVIDTAYQEGRVGAPTVMKMRSVVLSIKFDDEDFDLSRLGLRQAVPIKSNENLTK